MSIEIDNSSKGEDATQIAWPKICMGCGSQIDLVERNEPLKRAAAISATTKYRGGRKFTEMTFQKVGSRAYVFLCPTCKADALKSAKTRRLSGSVAVITSVVLLIVVVIPEALRIASFSPFPPSPPIPFLTVFPFLIALSFAYGLWIPLLFLSLGPAKPMRLFDVNGRLGIQSGSGRAGFSFKNGIYGSAFSSANPDIQTWSWELPGVVVSDLPYRVVKPPLGNSLLMKIALVYFGCIVVLIMYLLSAPFGIYTVQQVVYWTLPSVTVAAFVMFVVERILKRRGK